MPTVRMPDEHIAFGRQSDLLDSFGTFGDVLLVPFREGASRLLQNLVHARALAISEKWRLWRTRMAMGRLSPRRW